MASEVPKRTFVKTKGDVTGFNKLKQNNPISLGDPYLEDS